LITERDGVPPTKAPDRGMTVSNLVAVVADLSHTSDVLLRIAVLADLPAWSRSNTRVPGKR
jgi:hypothetical protein